MERTSKPRPWLWLAILMPLAVVATAVVLIGLGLVFNASGKNEPMSATERELLLDIEHLTLWLGDYRPDSARESAVKTRYFDDSYELEYVYDASDASAPYLTYSITFEGNESDAKATFTSFWGGTHVGVLVGEGDIGVRESDELFRWGDESKLGILTTEGRPFGNVFLARAGTRVVYCLVAGLYFDDAPAVEAFLAPHLEMLSLAQ